MGEHRGVTARAPNPYDLLPRLPGLVLCSDDISDGQTLPRRHVSSWDGAGGQDVSPHLSWSDYPSASRSFAITCLDPDAKSGSGFWHWAVVNVGASTTELPTGAGQMGGRLLPAGAFMLRNDAGVSGYSGAAPPPGEAPHRYLFAVHALPIEHLDIPDTASSALLGLLLTRLAIARALLAPVYGR